ncbi:MAG: peptidase PmbA [Methanomassiliicoccales archaeon PtaU1.Bin124]|nr:MAG: peptidase PmbA [Methanomassiliicoccales archaeon PtaU1.Bin124]
MKPEEVTPVVLRACRDAGATDAVVLVTEEEEAQIRFSNNNVTVSNNLREMSAYVFVFVKGKKAGTNIEDMSKRTLVTTAQKVVEAAKRSPGEGGYAPLPQGPLLYDDRLMNSEPVTQDPKDLMSMVREAIDAARREGAERVAGSMMARNIKLTLHTSADAFGTMERGGLEISLRAFSGPEASGHGLSVASTERDFHPSESGSEAGRLAHRAASPIEGTAGRMDAVFGPMVVADLMQQVGRMASAFHVDSGMSFLRGRLGHEVASKGVTLWDDATNPNSYGAQPFDQEGLPTQRKAIIEDGVLMTYLHNSTTAAKEGVESTANAGLVAPSPFSLAMSPGGRSLESLISGIDHGIYVTNDWYLRYQNFGNGDLSFIPRDAMFLIEGGSIGASLKELRVSDNVLRMLSNIDGIGQQRKMVKWWEVDTPVLVPAVSVKDVNFTRPQ